MKYLSNIVFFTIKNLNLMFKIILAITSRLFFVFYIVNLSLVNIYLMLQPNQSILFDSGAVSIGKLYTTPNVYLFMRCFIFMLRAMHTFNTHAHCHLLN